MQVHQNLLLICDCSTNHSNIHVHVITALILSVLIISRSFSKPISCDFLLHANDIISCLYLYRINLHFIHNIKYSPFVGRAHNHI